MKQLICKKIYILKTHIYSIIIKKKHVMHWGIFKYFLEQVTKNSFKNPFACTSYLWEKKLAILFQSNPFGSLLHVLTQTL
jgi:hypothetical protein